MLPLMLQPLREETRTTNGSARWSFTRNESQLAHLESPRHWELGVAAHAGAGAGGTASFLAGGGAAAAWGGGGACIATCWGAGRFVERLARFSFRHSQGGWNSLCQTPAWGLGRGAASSVALALTRGEAENRGTL